MHELCVSSHSAPLFRSTSAVSFGFGHRMLQQHDINQYALALKTQAGSSVMLPAPAKFDEIYRLHFQGS